MTVSQPVMQAVPSFEPLPPLLPGLLDPLPVSNCSATWNKRGCNTEMIVTQYNACYTMLVQLHIVLGTDGRPYPFRSGYHQVLSWWCWFNSPLNKLTIKCFWHLSIDLFKFDMLTAQPRLIRPFSSWEDGIWHKTNLHTTSNGRGEIVSWSVLPPAQLKRRVAPW